MTGPFSPKAEASYVSADCWPVDLEIEAFAAIYAKCIRCHGNDVRPGDVWGVGNLDMRSRSAIVKGGDRGPAVKPGNTAASILYWFIVPMSGEARSASPVDTPLQMPPAETLEPSEIEAIRAWIAAGAPEAK